MTLTTNKCKRSYPKLEHLWIMNKILYKFLLISPLLFFAACEKDDCTCPNIVGNSSLEIGDVYLGGIIFQIDASGQHGLVAKTQDTGLMNWYEAMDSESNDWSVPTIYQLGTIYDAIGYGADIINIGNFQMAQYWSSTTFSGGTGYAFNFANGESFIGYNGILNCRVRLIKPF